MSKFLDETGLQYLWDKTKDYVAEHSGEGAAGPPGPQGEKGDTGAKGADGKSAYQYAVDGGYAGTEEEFKALLADAAAKAYVDGLMNAVRADMLKAMEKIVCLVIGHSPNDLRINLKLNPFNTSAMDYSLTYSGSIPSDSGGLLSLEPPPGYAFTGLANTWQPAVKIGNQNYYGVLQADGSIEFVVPPSSAGTNFKFISVGTESAPARLILEVA